MEIEAIKKNIMQSVLKSVIDYNNSIDMLGHAVKKYFKDHYDENWYCFYDWYLVDNGNNIKIEYTEYELDDELNCDSECKTDIIPTETIVSIAVDLSLNKKI